MTRMGNNLPKKKARRLAASENIPYTAALARVSSESAHDVVSREIEQGQAAGSASNRALSYEGFVRLMSDRQAAMTAPILQAQEQQRKFMQPVVEAAGRQAAMMAPILQAQEQQRKMAQRLINIINGRQ